MNPRVVEYRVFGYSDIERLSAVVNEMVAKGYTPIGGIAIQPGTSTVPMMYLQATVLYEAMAPAGR